MDWRFAILFPKKLLHFQKYLPKDNAEDNINNNRIIIIVIDRSFYSNHMKAIIFDMDGVLVDAMPFHYRAIGPAIKESANIDLDKRTFYLLEGMPVANMALEIFKLKGYANNTKKISKKKIQETAGKS